MRYVAEQNHYFEKFEIWLGKGNINHKVHYNFILKKGTIAKKLSDTSITPKGKDIEDYNSVKELTELKKSLLKQLVIEKASKKDIHSADQFFNKFILYKKEKTKLYGKNGK